MTEVRIPWPNWEISELLGSGGFGTVYSIINQITGEESAVKVIPIPKEKSEIDSLRLEGYDDHSASERYKEQLDKIIDEYKIMARMKSHPHVVRCEDCAYTHHEDGIGWDVFIRMEKLVSLPKLLGKIEQDLAPEEVPRLGIDLCSALEMCQDMNIVHRDIKPENIFFSEHSGYKLGDFGIARTMEHATNATLTGSYRYMAPEVYKRQEYDQTVDIYSLGLVLYWLLNNRRMPFLPTDRLPKASENDEAIEKRLSGKQMEKPLHGSEDLKDVVMKACAYNSKDRYQNAKEMRLALVSVLYGQTVHNDRESVPKTKDTDFEIGAEEGESTVGPGDGNSRHLEKTGPEVTMGNAWQDSNETIGVGLKSSKLNEEIFDDGKTVGEPGTGNRDTSNRKDYLLRYEDINYQYDPSLKEGTVGNAFYITLTSAESLSETTCVKGDREVTIPANPVDGGIYSITESDGEKVYYEIHIYTPDSGYDGGMIVSGIGCLILAFLLYPEAGYVGVIVGIIGAFWFFSNA